MPVVGNRRQDLGNGYMNDPISSYAAAFRDTVHNILTESGTDLFNDPHRTMMMEDSNDTLRNFFVENSADKAGMTAKEYDEHMEMMNEMYLNDRQAVMEYSHVGQNNPVIGMTFPLHKNLLMNNIFDKGAIPKVVAREPKFTLSMETRVLVTPEGEEIDMFKQQMMMSDAIDATNPFVEVVMNLPEVGATDMLAAIKGEKGIDHLSIETEVSYVLLQAATSATEAAAKLAKCELVEIQSVKYIKVPVRLAFKPGYGELERTFIDPVKLSAEQSALVEGISAGEIVDDIISGSMHKDALMINAYKGKVAKVVVRARKDASNGMLETCSVRWKTKTDIVEIPSATPINTPVSPDEVKDISALYQVNQLSKIMSMFKIVLENHKDDSIKKNLDRSYLTMDPSSKIQGRFDFAPRDGYALDHVEWRHKTFFDALDTYVTEMMNVLNDPNMTVTVFGRPDLVRKITPTEYTYVTPSNIGPVELDFTKTVVTSDKRIYQFISSQKLRNSNELIIVLCPRNTDRIVYRIYDYQMYVSNEIRNVKLHTLPSIHAYERWKFVEYQPVQGRLQILNPTGMREQQLVYPEPATEPGIAELPPVR